MQVTFNTHCDPPTHNCIHATFLAKLGEYNRLFVNALHRHIFTYYPPLLYIVNP